MHRKVVLVLFFLLIPVFLFSQTGDDPGFDGWDVYEMDLYVRGDQTFVMSVGTAFPTVFIRNDGTIFTDNLSTAGFTGSLSYNFFLDSNVFLGLEIGFMIVGLIDQNRLFIVPAGLRGGYQFVVGRFEFPVCLTLGAAWQRHLTNGYVGFYLKAGGSAFFRFNAAWSFGLTTNWCWFPQWTSDSSKNAHGNILDLTFAARYHF